MLNRIETILARLLAVIALFATFAMAPEPALAQNTNQYAGTYVVPFPENDKYNLYIFGDSLGEGLWSGLEDALQADGRIAVFRKIRYGSGFARASKGDWAASVEDLLRNETVNIAVIFVGTAERLSIWTKKEKHEIGSEAWREIVATRVDRLIKRLQSEGAAIYWVGLPVMRSPKVNAEMQVLNEIFRERTFLNGAKFIDTWNAFADQFGHYSPHGTDMTGNIKRLRSDDGIHFTARGNRKLAHFVEKEIRKDIALARAERNIPLAGTVEQQRRITRVVPQKKKVVAKKGGKKGKASKKKRGWFSLVREKKANKKQVTTIGDIQIIRPVLQDTPGAAFASRSNRTAANAFIGEEIAKETDGDLTALGSISAVNVISLRAIKQRVPLAKAPYYKVLIRGENQTPKLGRADDFAWPQGDKSSKAGS